MTGDKQTPPDTQTATAQPASTISEEIADTAALVTTDNQDSNNPKAAAENNTPPKPVPTKKRSRLLLLICLLLLCAALGFSAYFAWQQWQQQLQQQTQQQAKVANLEAQNTQLTQHIAQLDQQQRQSTAAHQNTVKQLQQAQQLLQQRLDSHGQRLSSLAGTSRDDWLLAEARYLIRLANQRLLVDRSTEGALGLLRAADKILSTVDNAEILLIRKAIAEETIALKLANTFDRQGTYLRLIAIKRQIQSLPLIPFISPENTADKHTVNNAANNTGDPPTVWQALVSSINTAFANLGRFIQIRHHDRAPDLLISEQQQLHIVNNLSLMFEQAQFALLHEEVWIYQQSLQQALNWWQLYYGHYDEYETVQAELRHLKNINIVRTLPQLTRSSTLLSDYIERFHRIHTEADTEQQTTTLQQTTIKEDTTP